MKTYLLLTPFGWVPVKGLSPAGALASYFVHCAWLMKPCIVRDIVADIHFSN